MTDMKYCKDCKFLSVNHVFCDRPNLLKKGENPVDGKYIYRIDRLANEERDDFYAKSEFHRRDICGQKEAKYWQPSLWYKVKKFLRIGK